ncbi:MAG: hypothetical protein LLF94_05540 [Chlamydiales bacterium]|nr:hypothetical protein [Chlamydiales bacterium]
MSAINNDGKIQEPAKDVHEGLADELDSILNEKTTTLPGSVQSEAEAMMSQLENVPTTHIAREVMTETPVAQTFETVATPQPPEAKKATVHETEGMKVQGKEVNEPSQPQSLTRPFKPLPSLPTSESQKQEMPAMHTPISRSVPTTEPQKRQRAAMKELFNPEGKVGAVAKNVLPAKQEVKKEKAAETKAVSMPTPHVIEQKAAEPKEKIRFGAKITSFMQKHFPKLSGTKESTRSAEPKESGKISNFLQGLKARFSSSSRAAKVVNADTSSIGITTEKASKLGKMKLGNPIALIKGKLFANAGTVKYTEIPVNLSPHDDMQTHKENVRDILKRISANNNNEMIHIEDYPELQSFAKFATDKKFEIKALLNGESTTSNFKVDIQFSDLRGTKMAQQLSQAKTTDEIIEILSTAATQIKEILDAPEYEI